MTGWRMGYALAPEPLVSAMIKVQSQTIFESDFDRAVRGAGGDARADGFGRGDAGGIRTAARASSPDCARFPAGPAPSRRALIEAFPKVPGAVEKASGDSSQIARELLEQEHVAVVPGDAFGAPGHLRLSYATSLERIEEGLRRLTHFFAAA